jgi:hypothetical protein
MRWILLLVILSLAVPGAAAIIADHVAVSEFGIIPEPYFAAIRSNYNFYYGHTSHGSQIMSGLGLLSDENPVLFESPPFHETSDDLGHNGDTSWVAPTRTWLDSHEECNAVMWSWCGGCSDNSEAGIDIYLEAMSQLEIDYPEVLFIYMTGHLDGGGPEGNLYQRNNQIRDYCAANDKVLFDFADIESWDPDGNWYPDESDGCAWCSSWCTSHECPGCSYCAHSHCFNCYLKGKGFWWMMARVAGWQPSDVDVTPAPALRLAQNHPNPFNPKTDIVVNVANAGSGLLAIYDLGGRHLATLHKGYFDAGERIYSWDGRNASGVRAGSGIYLCRLLVGEEVQSIKMTLIE